MIGIALWRWGARGAYQAGAELLKECGIKPKMILNFNWGLMPPNGPGDLDKMIDLWINTTTEF